MVVAVNKTLDGKFVINQTETVQLPTVIALASEVYVYLVNCLVFGLNHEPYPKIIVEPENNYSFILHLRCVIEMS